MKFVSISDIDQLVLGYIAEQRYFHTRNKLFEESPYLPARVPILQLFGDISSENRLQTILEDYVSLKTKEQSPICAICNECDSLPTLWGIFDKVAKKIKKSHFELNSRSIQLAEAAAAANEDEVVGMQRLSPLELYHDNAALGNASSIERKRLNPVSNEYESATPEKNKQSGSAKRKSNMLPKRNRVPVHDEDLASLLNASDPNDALALVGVKILSNMKKCVGKGNSAPQELEMPVDRPQEEAPASGTNPETVGPSLDVQDLITDETRDGLVEMTIDSLMNSAVPADIAPPCDLANSNDDFFELRKLLDCRPTASCINTGFDDFIQNQQDERDLMEIIKEDDIPNQPSTAAPSLLAYNLNEKSTVTDPSSTGNSLAADKMPQANAVDIAPNVEIELPAVRNIRSELSETAVEINNQESRSSHFSFSDFRNIDPDDFIDACANMPPKKRFLVKENMTPEKLQGRSFLHHHRRDISNSLSSMPELMMNAPPLGIVSSSVPDAVTNFSPVNNQNERRSVPETVSLTPKKLQGPSILNSFHETSSNVGGSSCTAPESMPTTQPTTTVSAIVSGTVTDAPPVNNQDEGVLDAISVSKDNSSKSTFTQETNTETVEEPDTSQNIFENVEMPEESCMRKSQGETAICETVSGSTDNATLSSFAQTDVEIIKEPESTRHILDDLGMPEQGSTRRSKRKTKANIALRNLVPRPQSKSAKKSAKSNSSKKKGSSEKKNKKDGEKSKPTDSSKVKLLRPGQGRVVINLKNSRRMPIEVPGIIVAPENQSSISKEDIVKNLVSQMQQANREKTNIGADNQTDIDTASDHPTPNKDAGYDASDSDALMIDEGVQNPVLDEDYVANTVLQALRNCPQVVPVDIHVPPEHLGLSPIVSQAEYSPQVSDSNVQCEVEVQTAHDESIVPLIGGGEMDHSNQMNVQTNNAITGVSDSISDEQHVATSHGQCYNKTAPSSQATSSHHGLMMDANSFPRQESVFPNDTDSTRDRIRAFQGGSYSSELLETNVPVLEGYDSNLISLPIGGALTTPQRPRSHNMFSTISPSSGIFSVINEESHSFSPKGKRNLSSAKSNLLSSFALENNTDRPLTPHNESIPMDQSRIADLQQLLEDDATEADSQLNESSKPVTGAKPSKSRNKRASVKKTGGSGAIMSSQSKSMVRAEPKSHGASVVKRCLVQSRNAKDAMSRRTRSGRVFGTQKSNEKVTEKVASPMHVINKESGENDANVTPLPSKTDSENGTLKRKKPSKAKEKRKKPRHSAGFPAINWSYEEIQARLDAIHGKKDKADKITSPKCGNETTSMNPNNHQNRSYEGNQPTSDDIHGKKGKTKKDLMKSGRSKNLRNPIGNRSWSHEEIQAKLDAIHGKKDQMEERINSPELNKGANFDNACTERPIENDLNPDNEPTDGSSDNRTCLEAIHTNNQNLAKGQDCSNDKSSEQNSKQSQHKLQEKVPVSVTTEKENQTQDQQSTPCAETPAAFTGNPQELTSDRGIEITDNTDDNPPPPVNECPISEQYPVVNLNASIGKHNKRQDLSLESVREPPRRSIHSCGTDEQCELSRPDPRKPRRIVPQQIMTWDRPLPGWAAGKNSADDTGRFAMDDSEVSTDNTRKRYGTELLNENAIPKAQPKTSKNRKKSKGRSKKISKFSLLEKQIKKMDIQKFLNSLEYEKVS